MVWNQISINPKFSLQVDRTNAVEMVKNTSRKGQLSMTTQRLQKAANVYIESVIQAERAVEAELSTLNVLTEKFISSIGVAANFIMIFQVMTIH